MIFKPKQKLIELADIPQSSVGAPIPTILADESRVSLIFYLDNRDPKWDGTTVRVVGSENEKEPVAVIRYNRPYMHSFGPPNDEAITGHPLAKIGLQSYAAYEVVRSHWIHELCSRNRVHPYHTDKMFAQYKHYILTFHDSTFEIGAESYEVEMLGQMSAMKAAHLELDRWTSQPD